MTDATEKTAQPVRIAGGTRRRLIKAIGAATLLGGAGVKAQAQHASDFPNRPITLILPWTPGGSTDTVMRQLAISASKILGQPIVVVNKPGAGGTLGPAQMAATAKPDGYTICQVATSLMRLPHLQETSYDPRTDFSYIVGLSAWTTGVIVHKDAPWKSWKELAAHARAKPGSVSYATSGIGSSLHIYMEEIAQAEGIKLLHVPYNGSNEMGLALLRKDVDFNADALGGAVPILEGGKARLLVTWGAQRTARWPEVPTLKEQGLNVVAVTPYGLAGPKGMDPAIVRSLHDAFRQARLDPAHKALCDKYLFEDYYQSSSDFERWARDTYVAQGKALALLGLAKSR